MMWCTPCYNNTMDTATSAPRAQGKLKRPLVLESSVRCSAMNPHAVPMTVMHLNPHVRNLRWDQASAPLT